MGFLSPDAIAAGFDAAERAELETVRHPTGRTSRSVLDLLVAWALNVEKIDLDRVKPASDPRVWGAHDLVGALFLRDFLEDRVRLLSPDLRSKVEDPLAEVDARFLACTRADDRGLAGQVAEIDVAGRGWWWHRVPDSGPMLEELSEYG